MRATALVAATLAAVALSPVRADDATPVAMDAGTTKSLCGSGLVSCPVSTFMCDDPKVAIIENGPQGAVLRAVAPGTTLCAVSGSAGTFRRILRVTVKARQAPAGEGAPAR